MLYNPKTFSLRLNLPYPGHSIVLDHYPFFELLRLLVGLVSFLLHQNTNVLEIFRFNCFLQDLLPLPHTHTVFLEMSSQDRSWEPHRDKCNSCEPLDYVFPIYSQAFKDKVISKAKQCINVSFLSLPVLCVSFQYIKSFVCKLPLSNYLNLGDS